MLLRLFRSPSRLAIQYAIKPLLVRASLPRLNHTMATEPQSINAPPREHQVIEHNGQRYTTIKEGLAHILVPIKAGDDSKTTEDSEGGQSVFYNPIQQFNRDLTVLTLKAYGKEKLQEKEIARQDKNSRFAEKKRKRREEKNDNRPAKLQKTEAEEESAEVAAQEPADAALEVKAASEALPDPEPIPPNEREAGSQLSGQNGHEENKKPHQFTILDALSATGLRALRYAHEIPFLTSVTSNDLLATAVESIKLNVQHNKLEDKIKVSKDDALAHMYSVVISDLRRRDHRGRVFKSDKYDVVDLDPYGTAAPFLDAAVQAVRDDGGLLCVTCTDAGVWASNGYPEKAFALYGGIPMKGGMQSHEGGLRLILHAIESSAARYGLAIEPLLSLSIDFYLRVFVRIRKSPASVKFQAGRNILVYNCDSGCGAWTTQLLARNKAVPNKKGDGRYYKHVFAPGPTTDKTCEHCGSIMHLSGPMYGGRIHSVDFIKKILAEVDEASPDIYGTVDRLKGMLVTALEEYLPTPEEEELLEKLAQAEKTPDEVPADQATKALASLKELELAEVDPYPFFFIPTVLAAKMQCITPPENPLRGALIGLGYRVTRSHCKAGSMKTDAPWSVIWHVMREYVRQKAPVTERNIKVGSPAYRLLQLDKRNTSNEEEEASTAEQDQPEVVFDERLGRDPAKGQIIRYQMNPRENWGPMSKAKGN
jgi:tRNA (guanine26-N2/guanine27-N2)-dimethyltransferase